VQLAKKTLVYWEAGGGPLGVLRGPGVINASNFGHKNGQRPKIQLPTFCKYWLYSSGGAKRWRRV